MKILGAVPAYPDSPLDGLWLELAKTHDVILWGAGRPGYERGAPLADVAGDADLALLADPASKGAEAWDCSGLRCRKAAVLVDTHHGRRRRAAWIARQGVDLVLLRARDHAPAFRALLPGTRVEWLPFGFDPIVFHDYGEARVHDVAIVGHLGVDAYPVRERARRVLLDQDRFSVLDACIAGDRPPLLTGEGYARVLGMARVAIATCGIPRYVHQKYLEIPACGTLLVGNEPANGFRDILTPDAHLKLFRDDGSDLLTAIDAALAAGDALRTRACQRVHARHTNRCRVAQLERMLGWRK